ncbi:hypothetical protein [Ferruginibacter sp. SUN106]|uniref:hypothetical protein n=1 Tax=Ferruginibacter sp. SUN106 TaxID=2978348 RepID=UPI003D360908
MAYKAYFSLDSVKVIRSDGEDGEYSFRLYYENNLYSIINTPENVADGSIWRGAFVAYQTKPLALTDKFKLKLESIEYDGGLRFGNGYAMTEKEFDINSKGIHTIYMKDNDENEIEFRVAISINVDSAFGDIVTTQNTENNLIGAMIYEDWHYNKESDSTLPLFAKARSQHLAAGEYDLPYEPDIRTGGRWGSFGKVLGVRPDTISSLKIGNGYYVELFDMVGRTGNSITLSENTPEIPASWNDKAKSIIVTLRQQPR